MDFNQLIFKIKWQLSYRNLLKKNESSSQKKFYFQIAVVPHTTVMVGFYLDKKHATKANILYVMGYFKSQQDICTRIFSLA